MEEEEGGLGSRNIALALPSSVSLVQFALVALIMPITPVMSSMKKGGEIKERDQGSRNGGKSS